MKIGLIGQGAIAGYVAQQLEGRGHKISAYLLRPARVAALQGSAATYVSKVAALPDDLDHVIDCAGHEALRSYGPDVLRRGFDLTTVSLGALADPGLEQLVKEAATSGGSHLYLANGAIGALDALRSAKVGALQSVRYVGRKPPQGWLGSPAEQVLDLTALEGKAQVHFEGTARAAAQAYPKNANVAAAVALAGIGFDLTQAQLIADPTIHKNIHEITAKGDFGQFTFTIAGNALPGNPKSSALAAMSVVATIDQQANAIRF